MTPDSAFSPELQAVLAEADAACTRYGFYTPALGTIDPAQAAWERWRTRARRLMALGIRRARLHPALWQDLLDAELWYHVRGPGRSQPLPVGDQARWLYAVRFEPRHG